MPVSLSDRVFGVAEILILLLVVFLTNRITRSMRAQHRRLQKQNRQVREMSRQVRRQHRAMIQHEKMVALGQMAAGVTHEIANPLASMDSVLQLAQRKPDKLRPDFIATLREQVSRINQIILQMKTFAHPTDTQLQLTPLNEIVEQALEMVRFDKRIRNVSIKRHLSPDVGLVRVMPQATQQVLVNLMINSLDAMADAAYPTLTLSTERVDGDCVITVTDNGQGIRPEHMSRLFEPFFTTKPVAKGTGLGLSISYSLVRKQGGQITAVSETGKGTTFAIRLPASQGSSQNRERDEPRIAGSGKSDR
jgi:C4-dicarboxylate-specific signal transduction histidine kinase